MEVDMPRQIHVTITAQQQDACRRIGQDREPAQSWQDVCRQMIEIGLARETSTVFCRTCGRPVPDADESEIGNEIYRS